MLTDSQYASLIAFVGFEVILDLFAEKIGYGYDVQHVTLRLSETQFDGARNYLAGRYGVANYGECARRLAGDIVSEVASYAPDATVHVHAPVTWDRRAPDQMKLDFLQSAVSKLCREGTGNKVKEVSSDYVYETLQREVGLEVGMREDFGFTERKLREAGLTTFGLTLQLFFYPAKERHGPAPNSAD